MASIRPDRLAEDSGDLRAVNEIDVNRPHGGWMGPSVRSPWLAIRVVPSAGAPRDADPYA